MPYSIRIIVSSGEFFSGRKTEAYFTDLPTNDSKKRKKHTFFCLYDIDLENMRTCKTILKEFAIFTVLSKYRIWKENDNG